MSQSYKDPSGLPSPAKLSPPEDRLSGSVRELSVNESGEIEIPTNSSNTFLPATSSAPANTIEEARDIIDAARDEAEEILQRASVEAHSIEVAARVEGLRQGQVEASKSLLEIEQLRTGFQKDTKREVLSLVLDITEQVLGEALENQPQGIVSRIERAIQGVLGESKAVIFVHTNDLAHVSSRISELQINSGVKLEIDVDDTLVPGEARLETPVSTITSSITTHLRAIRATLLASGD